MATKNRPELKLYFKTDKRPTEIEFENLIDSNLNIEEDKASEIDAQNAQIDNKYLTPKTAKQNVLAFAPVKKVNNINPDSNGNITVTNVSGSASTITGSIPQSQVTGLTSALNSKQANLVSGSNIKTINGQSILGSGNIEVPTKLIGVLSSNFTLVDTNTVQTAFPTSCDQFGLLANKTYFIKGKYIIGNGAFNHTTSIGWLLDGLVVTSMEYVVRLFSSTLNGITTASSNVHVSGTASKVLNAASTAVTTTIEFEGVLRCTTGGKLIPQLTFSAAPGGTNLMKMGSFIELTEIGSNTIEKVGLVQ